MLRDECKTLDEKIKNYANNMNNSTLNPQDRELNRHLYNMAMAYKKKYKYQDFWNNIKYGKFVPGDIVKDKQYMTLIVLRDLHTEFVKAYNQSLQFISDWVPKSDLTKIGHKELTDNFLNTIEIKELETKISCLKFDIEQKQERIKELQTQIEEVKNYND